MNRAVLPALLAAVVLGVSGCSWVGGWFGASAPKVKPAELVDFKPSLAVSKAWDINVGVGKPYLFALASDGEAVYAAGKDGRIVRIDPTSGREVWRQETGRALSAGVGVGNGLVLVGTLKGEVLAYRAADGQAAWTTQLSGEVLTPPVAGGGVVAARGNDGRVYLLDAATGKQRWVYSRGVPALVLREPAHLLLTDKVLYAGHPGGKLTALALNNGAPLWEVNVALPKGATELERVADVVGTLAMDDRLICAAAYQGRAACFELRNGNPVWGRDFSGLGGVDLDASNLYAADDGAIFQAFDKFKGTSQWKQDKLRGRGLGSPLALGNQVAVGDYQGHVHLLNVEDGAFAARVATDGSAIVGPLLPLTRGFIALTANGGVYAFKLQ